jgi:5-methylcytosine-specific restriction endonuclease McrA
VSDVGADRYTSYLATAHWVRKREEALQAAGYRCERCGFYGQRDQDGRRHGLDVHHLTYERLGHEHLADLETLCRTCHREEHGLPGPTREQERARVTNRINRRLGLDFESDEVDLEVEAWDSLAEQAGL